MPLVLWPAWMAVAAKAGSQIGLSTEGIADAGDGARVGGLDAGGGALDMVVVSHSRTAVTVRPATGGLHHREIRRVLAAAHTACARLRIQRQAFTAVADHTAEGLYRMRFTDLRQVGVAGQAVFHLTGQCGRQGDWFDAATFLPGNSQQGQ